MTRVIEALQEIAEGSSDEWAREKARSAIAHATDARAGTSVPKTVRLCPAKGGRDVTRPQDHANHPGGAASMTNRYIVTVSFTGPNGTVETESSIQHLEPTTPFIQAVEEFKAEPGEELVGLSIIALEEL